MRVRRAVASTAGTHGQCHLLLGEAREIQGKYDAIKEILVCDVMFVKWEKKNIRRYKIKQERMETVKLFKVNLGKCLLSFIAKKDKHHRTYFVTGSSFIFKQAGACQGERHTVSSLVASSSTILIPSVFFHTGRYGFSLHPNKKDTNTFQVDGILLISMITDKVKGSYKFFLLSI